MGSHYIPVGKLKIDKEILDLACPAAGYSETPPDPAIFCPANGYTQPNAGYIPDPVLPTIETPLATQQIILICSNQYNGYVRFYVYGGASGFTWEVYGNGDALLANGSQANGSFEYTFIGAGYEGADGTLYYKLVFRPVGAENITQFRPYSTTVVYPVIEAYVNAPNITLMSFNNFQLTKKAWCCDAMDYLNQTSSYPAFKNTYSLDDVTLPSSMNLQTNLIDWFSYSSVKAVTLPASMNALTSISGIFSYAETEYITLPGTCPNLVNIYQSFAYMPYLKSISFPETWPNGISALHAFRDSKYINAIGLFSFAITTFDYLFNNCYNLGGTLEINLSSSSSATLMQYFAAGCRSLKKLILTGTADTITSLNYLANNASVLEEIVLPTSMNALTSFVASSFGIVPNLKKLTLPLSMTGLNTSAIQLFNAANENVEEITTCNDWGAAIKTSFGFGAKLYKLKIFNQPTLKAASITITGTSTKNTLLESIEVDWSTLSYIDISYNNLGATELDRIMTALPSIASGVFKITSNPGTATCTPSIATAKGWTVS